MPQHTGSTGNQQDDMDGREALLEECLSQLFDAYDQAKSEKTIDPVLFLVDCEDEIGAAIARSWEGDDAVDAAILASADGESSEEDSSITTTLARSFAFEECRDDVPELFPYLSGTFERTAPEDGFLVVVITYGGAGTFTVPTSARPG